MKQYDVTIWPEDNRKPYTERVSSPTSIDAMLRALQPWRDFGVSVAHVRLVTAEEQASDQPEPQTVEFLPDICLGCSTHDCFPRHTCRPPTDGSLCRSWRKP